MSKLVTLQSERDFAHHKFKKSLSSPALRVRVAQSPLAFPRFGFIIPKKVMPKVTDRNKVKRRIKSIVAKNLDHIKPADVLLFPQKNSLKLYFLDLQTELLTDLKKLGLWK